MHTVAALRLLLTTLLVLGCGKSQGTREPRPPVAVDTPRSPERPVHLSCAPSRLHPGDTLTLSMLTPHGDYLAVIRPDSAWYFLVYPIFGRDTTLRSPMVPADTFRSMGTLRVAVSGAMATPAPLGGDRNEVLFTKPGRYTFELGVDFETDAPDSVYRCPVDYGPGT